MAGPIDWIFQFMRRPRSVITKSQYIERARGLAQRAKEIKAMGDMLKRQDRAGGRDRSWRNNLKRVQREVLQLEEDHQALDAVFPQVCVVGVVGVVVAVLLLLVWLLRLLRVGVGSFV